MIEAPPLLIALAAAFLFAAGVATCVHAQAAAAALRAKRARRGALHGLVAVLWPPAAACAILLTGFDAYLGALTYAIGIVWLLVAYRQPPRGGRAFPVLGLALFGLGFLWGVVPYPAQAATSPPGVAPPRGAATDVVELVDFSCPHCRAEAQYIPQIARRVAEEGGIFRIAPIGPQQDGVPAPAVSVYYALLTASRNSARAGIAAAGALYRGYQAQADLAGPQGVLSWLETQMGTIPQARILRLLDTQRPQRRFWKAVGLAKAVSASLLPVFIYLSVGTGAVLGADQWRGDAGSLAKRVFHRLGE